MSQKKPIDENYPLSITDFCKVEGISPYTYHEKLRPRGLIPKEFRIPGTQIVRISPEARREWHERMDREEIQEQIERERERRVAFAREAGKAGAASPLHRRAPTKQSTAGPKKRGRPRKHMQAAE